MYGNDNYKQYDDKCNFGVRNFTCKNPNLD